MSHHELLKHARIEFDAYVKNLEDIGEPLFLFEIDNLLASILIEQLEDIVELDSAFIGDYIKKYFDFVEQVTDEYIEQYGE